MRYAQVAGGQRLHLVYEGGEGPRPDVLTPDGELSAPLCGRQVPAVGYRMNINLPLANACRNCLRVQRAHCNPEGRS